MKHKLYYCPMETPSKIRFISKESNIDEVVDPTAYSYSGPVWFRELFKSLKEGKYDEIVVTVGKHNGCYFYEDRELKDVIGEVALSEFSDGGGYPSDSILTKDHLISDK